MPSNNEKKLKHLENQQLSQQTRNNEKKLKLAV